MVSDKCKCGIPMTELEIAEQKMCMKCAMRKIMTKSISLGMADTVDLDPEDYGRTDEEMKLFKEELKKEKPKAIVKKTKISSGNNEIDLNLYKKNDGYIELVAIGVNEDVSLKLTIPKTYPIDKVYFDNAEEMLKICLKEIVHFLAFAPLVNTTLESYLAERFGVTPKYPNEGD